MLVLTIFPDGHALLSSEEPLTEAEGQNIRESVREVA